MEMIGREARYVLFMATSVSWQEIEIPRERMFAMLKCIVGTNEEVAGPVDTCPLVIGTDLYKVGTLWVEDVKAKDVLKKCAYMFNEECGKRTSCT